jgi:hypothetical protein
MALLLNRGMGGYGGLEPATIRLTVERLRVPVEMANLERFTSL